MVLKIPYFFQTRTGLAHFFIPFPGPEKALQNFKTFPVFQNSVENQAECYWFRAAIPSLDLRVMKSDFMRNYIILGVNHMF